MSRARTSPKPPARTIAGSLPSMASPHRDADFELLEQSDASLLEIVDHVLNKGVMVTGEAMLGVAGVDLVYLRLSALLCAADRVMPGLTRKRDDAAVPSPPRRRRAKR